MTRFGKLEAVAIRDGWQREDTEFTPWLSQEENLAALGEEIGIELELIQTEKGVGSYRLDILAKRAGSEESVVIENQFGATDHCHLGQLLTYASGVGADGAGAKTIIWIAEHFNEPHRAALDWLNKSTEPGIRFFGVEIQLWRIGDSAYAPKFNVVSRPNDWQKQLTQETAALSSADHLYQDFWDAFTEFCGENTTLVMPPAQPKHWMPTSIGRTGFGVNLAARKKLKRIECELLIDARQAKEAFSALSADRDKIVAALGNQLDFEEMDRRKAYRIFETSVGDVADREQWPAIHRWLKERGEAYAAVFTPLVKQLKLD